MYSLIICTLLAQQAPEEPSRVVPPIVLDGTWTVLCLEKNGQPMKQAKMKTVTIRNNIITCNSTENHEMKIMRVEFGPDATVRVTDITKEEGLATATNVARDPSNPERPKTGVCVVTKDYLAICLHDNAADGNRTSMKASEQFANEPQTKPTFTVILKRNND